MGGEAWDCRGNNRASPGNRRIPHSPPVLLNKYEYRTIQDSEEQDNLWSLHEGGRGGLLDMRKLRDHNAVVLPVLLGMRDTASLQASQELHVVREADQGHRQQVLLHRLLQEPQDGRDHPLLRLRKGDIQDSVIDPQEELLLCGVQGKEAASYQQFVRDGTLIH